MLKSKILPFFFALCLFLAGCGTTNHFVPPSQHSENNSQITANVSDTRERDSIFVYIEKTLYKEGDTVYIEVREKEHKESQKTRVDTFFRDVEIHIVDSIPYPVPVTDTVYKTPDFVIWSILFNVIFIVLVFLFIWRKLHQKGSK